MEQIKRIAAEAKEASYALAKLTEGEKNQILYAIADALVAQAGEIIEQNLKDLELANSNGRPDSFRDRLLLNESRIDAMAEGLRKVAALKDPIGEVLGGGTAGSGIRILKKRVPLGVLGIIYEARPNVTSDAIGIAIKTGNAVVLKGGRDAINSNLAIARIAAEAGGEAGLPYGSIGMIEHVEREATTCMMGLRESIDVLIPRGGEQLIASVVENAKIPVIETGTGNCHIFVDESADLTMAEQIVVNAKVSRPSVCNSAETLLVHQNIAERFLPIIIPALEEERVEIRGDAIAQRYGDVMPAMEQDYYAEFLDYIIAVKVVEGVEEAVRHINHYGTKHSEAIVTRDIDNATYFQDSVDAAAVYVNASTRFTDGEEFGFGAEIGISTQKLHARGPMGLAEMTTYKYLIEGDGQIR